MSLPVVASATEDSESRKAFHLTLLAKNLEGYQNLIKLSFVLQVTGFYFIRRACRVNF